MSYQSSRQSTTKTVTSTSRNQSGSRTVQEFSDTSKSLELNEGDQIMTFPDDFKLIATDMPEADQLEILAIVMEASNRSDRQKENAKMIKQALDSKLERLWHVVIVLGQYWNFVSHEPGHCFNFKLGRHIYMIWRTPGY